MSKYSTIGSNYLVSEVNEDCDYIREIKGTEPLFTVALDKMVNSFNAMKLETCLDDKEAKRKLGYTIKEKIKSIRMKRLERTDEEGRPYVRITIETYPRMLKLTRKVCDFLDDFISSEFSDGWGECVFGIGNSFKAPDGTLIAIE